MNKADKAFITGLIKGLDSRFSGLENRFDGLEGRFSGLENGLGGFKGEINAKIESLKKDMKGIETRLGDEIRHNGVLIEQVRDDQQLFAEGFSGLVERVARIETDVSEIKEGITDYPAVRAMAIRHDIKLAK